MLQNLLFARHRQQRLVLFLVAAALSMAIQPVCAQSRHCPAPALSETANQPERVYCGHYAVQLPELPGGGGTQAIAAAIRGNLEYPLNCTSQGKVFARFTVRPDGSVADVEIVRGLSDVCDYAVIDAIRRLPRFVPGKEGGQVVATSFIIPVSFANP